jgi:cyclin D5
LPFFRGFQRRQEWALQLLAVACLSLAAKVEEHRVPRLPEFRPDQYDFDCASILRMELLVLSTLKWQMIAGTPFPYLGCFAARLRHGEREAIVLRAVKCIFASIKGVCHSVIPPSPAPIHSDRILE